MGMIVAPVDLGAQNNCSASNTIKMCESIANKVPDRHISFVLAGNLIPGKNQHAAVKAAHILKQRGITNFVILLAGASTDLKESKKYEAMLIKEIEKYNLQDQVKLCGFIKNMHEFRQDADCEIVASKSEAYGRVTIEAMLAGNLVIASTSGSGPELLGDINPNFPNNPNWRQRGILFSQEASMSDDEIATNLADSMIQVIHTMNDANANKKILQIIDKAMAYVFAEHRTEIAVDKVEALYSVQ